MSQGVDIREVSAVDAARIRKLVARSDAYLSALYPPQSNHAEPLDALLGPDAVFLVADVDGEPAACGAVKFCNGAERYGEIKRVFVAEEHRGKRLAISIIDRLEAKLIANDIRLVRLEAGPLQPEALGLYRRLGYAECGPFGDYVADPLSVFMQKRLGGQDRPAVPSR